MGDIGEKIKAHPQLAIIGLVGLGIVMFLLAGKSGGSAFKPSTTVPTDTGNPPPNDYASSAMVQQQIQEALNQFRQENPPPGEPPPTPAPVPPGGNGNGGPLGGGEPGPVPPGGGEGQPPAPGPHPHPGPHWGNG